VVRRLRRARPALRTARRGAAVDHPDEALRAFRELGARKLVPMHWGTWDLADDAVDEPPRELARQLARPEHADLAARVRILAVGERLLLGR